MALMDAIRPEMFFPTFVWNAEDGAVGGNDPGGEPADAGDAGAPAPEDGAVGGSDLSVDDMTPPDGMTIEEFKEVLNEDPEFADMVKKEQEQRKAPQGKKQPQPPDEGEEGPAANADTGEPDEGDGDTGGDAVFADDIIKGLKGEHLSALPEDAQTAIGEFYQEHEATREELGRTKQQLDAILEDPIVQHRKDLIAQGKGGLEYELPKMADEDKRAIQEQFDLDDGDMEKLDKLIYKHAERVARAHTYNQSMYANQKQQVEQRLSEGKNALMKLGELNPNLKLKETDLSKFFTTKNNRFVYNEDHPEIEQFKNGVGKIREWAINKKMNYADIADFVDRYGSEALYTAAAKDLKMPVAFNTEERDGEIVKRAKQAALKPFLKGSSAGLASRSGSSHSGQARQKTEAKERNGGYNIERLATDEKYYSEAIERGLSGKGAEEHMAKINALRAKGEAALRKRSGRRSGVKVELVE